LVGHTRKQDAIRGGADVFYAAHGFQGSYEIDNPAPHERFAPGNPNMGYPERGCYAHYSLYFLIPKYFSARKVIHLEAGLAIRAGKVAAVGYGYSEIIDASIHLIKKLHVKNCTTGIERLQAK
jgi:hypothetical protein